MTRRSIFESVGFQSVWLASAVGAAGGSSVPGLLAAGAFIAAQMATSRRNSPLVTMLASGTVGCIVESVLVAAGLLQYATPWPGPPLAPVWVVALWLAFGSILATAARVLEPRAVAKSAVLGALLAPLSYATGQRLGAIQIADPSWVAYVAIAVTWSISFPALIALRRWSR